ncbi:MAG: GDSL-type esterase/lipase family protein [Patescibacteria group bacterium]
MTNSQVIIAVFGVLILGGVFYFFSMDRRYIDKPRTGSAVIAFGDSLIEGVGSSQGNDLVSLLSQELKIPIINAGISGDTTFSALTRVSLDVLNHDPKIVILLLGGNDAIRRYKPLDTFRNLEEIIARIHAQGSAVLLLGVRGGFFSDAYKKEFKSLAQKTKVSYIPDVLSGVFGRSRYMYDAIHPNDEGYRIIADRIKPILLEMLNH